jgi:hypothetical protein
LKVFLERQGVGLLLDINAIMFMLVPILHYYHGFMADAAGREASFRVSGIVAFLPQA